MGTHHEEAFPPIDDGGDVDDINEEDRESNASSSSVTSSGDDDMDSNLTSSEDDFDDSNAILTVQDKTRNDLEDDEDPVINAIAKAKEKKSSDHPPDLLLDAIPSTLAFHPVEDQVAFGNYDGKIMLYKYSVEGNTPMVESLYKDHSVRAITFNQDGRKLISAFNDHVIKIYDVEKELQEERTIKNATSAPVSSVYLIDENTFATGDDDGNVLLWDNRAKTSASPSLRLGEDAITSMVSNEDRRILVCTSEEGAIYAVKIRGGKVQVESEIYDYEFNCSCVFKQESKLAVGDGKGDVYIFNWNEFGKHSDVAAGIGRGEAIQAMIPITERIILCGGDDGFIRAYNFFPHKFMGIVGKVGHPVEKLDVCNDGHLIASIGADETVKFWNVSYFENMPASKNSKNEGKGYKRNKHKTNGQNQDLTQHNLPSSSHQNSTDFFKGLTDN